MTKQVEEEKVVAEIVPAATIQYEAVKDKPVLSLSRALAEMGISGRRVTAEQLVDQTFTILRAKAFASRFQEGTHAYFCVCQPQGGGEVFTTVLGGRAVVDVLDAFFATGLTNPLEVRLSEIEGGRFGRYYVLE